MITLSELIEIIQNGENSAVEFKSTNVRSESLAKELVALSNSQGGVILIGVEDNGDITGLSSAKNYEEWVMNIARNNVVPATQVSYYEHPIQSKTVGLVIVERGLDKPYQTTDAKYLVRIGTTNRIATQAELLRLFQASGAFHFDATPVYDTSFNDLNLAKIDSYFGSYGLEFSQENETDKQRMLVNSDMMTNQGDVTVGGLLIFGVNPARYLPQSGISFAHFNGSEVDDELIDKQNIEGTLDYQIDRGTAIIKNNWLTPSSIVGNQREDTGFIFPDKVFRELLTNACIHRNYAIHGSKIRVFMFDDRIEFRSPGRLPNTITVEKLKIGVSYASNPVLLKFMENLRYVDRLGRGLPMVYREAKRNNKTIEFKEVGEEFRVVLSI